MQMIDETTVLVNPETGLIDEGTDAVMDATDVAYALGREDATEGKRQDAFIFIANLAAWAAYHEGYREGSIQAAILTGTTRRYWDPQFPNEIQSVSWNSSADYVPFQMPKEAYADVQPDYMREDWVGK
jgi:hypothetical protein